MAKTCKQCGGTVENGAECRLCEMFAAAAAPGGTATSGWPMVSNAMSVHPRQAAKANARNKNHGIAAVYDERGRCHVADAGNRKKLMKLQGLQDHNAFS